MATDSFLDVETSFQQARWISKDIDLSEIEKIARKHDLPEVVARLLAVRGVPEDEIDSFLSPTLKNDFPDPFSLAGMAALAEDIAQAVKDKRKVAVFGDFDVDGATSTAILYHFFKHFGLDVPFYIPDRMAEGYGPNIGALEQLQKQGAEIVIMVDCGTTAFEIVQQGRDLGLEIVILDHHEAEESLPNANHVINPKRKDDTSGLDMLAAVGVCFMTCVAINAKLREKGADSEAPLKDWLDIVALGTVADMVPLTGVNRLLVRQGFLKMATTNNVGLRALLDVAGVKDAPNPYHAGFVLGPRINAGSRVHEADLGARLLSTDDPEEAKNIAWTLNDCNDKRKDIQREMEREAIEQVESQGLDQHPVIIAAAENWHPGLSGLVAGGLKEKYKKPACVVTFIHNQDDVLEGRGSGRSVPGIHIAQAFIDARQAEIVEKGGGHAMAGGFTIKPEKLEEFRAFMIDHIGRQQMTGSTNVETNIDAVMSVKGVRADFVKMIQNHLGPFGQEQPEPLFVLSNVRIVSADVVGTNHVRATISDSDGGARMKCVAFRALDTPLGDALLQNQKALFHIAGYFKINSWQGRESVEMHIQDAAFAMGQEVQKAVSV
jgi:single-stranded-DNA-specific exonuclease